MLKKWGKVTNIHKHHRLIKLACVHYLNAVWLAMVAQTQAEFPYYYEKKIRVAKKKLTFLLLTYCDTKKNSTLFNMFTWLLQFNALRRLLNDSHLLKLSFQPFSDLRQAICHFFLAKNLSQQQLYLHQYEEAYWQFESFYQQVLLTTAQDMMPWHAWTRHLKVWMQYANDDLLVNEKKEFRWQKKQMPKMFFWRFRFKDFNLFAESLIDCLQAFSNIFYELLKYPYIDADAYCPCMDHILKITFLPSYPEWVFKYGFNPALRASWRYFLLELEKYFDLTYILLFTLNQSTEFIAQYTPIIQIIFDTEKKLFDALIVALSKQQFITTDAETYADIDQLSQAIIHLVNQFALTELSAVIPLDQLRFYYVIEQHRVAILNLLHAFPSGDTM